MQRDVHGKVLNIDVHVTDSLLILCALRLQIFADLLQTFDFLGILQNTVTIPAAKSNNNEEG